ncbi:MAG: hypothetical protein K2X81_17935 [Candidatus Obscuribacterales bacterium]|nr:hypothetical protein [Candidatus Obscuribacterales bacterium]
MTGATAIQKATSCGGINQWKRQEFLSLYPNRAKHICKGARDEKWKTLRVPLFTGMIDEAISGQCDTFYGAFWGDRTEFAVIDIDSKNSRYYNKEALGKILAELAAVGLSANLYQSSDSKGWHLYIPFEEKENSSEVEQTLKRWLKALGYVIVSGQLEVFPGGNALRLPLQAGFAWLAQDGSLIQSRKEIETNEALSAFLSDLRTNAQDWSEAKSRIESQIMEIDRAAGSDAQEQEDRLAIEGFEQLYSSGKDQEIWQKGRKYWLDGLQKKGERHDAVLAVGHYLWYGDEDQFIAALPGQQNAEYRANLIEAWLRKNHNGKCRHINEGNWEIVRAQIERAAHWRREKVQWERPHYPLTSRLLKRLVALYRRSGRIWSIEQFEKANQDKRQEARARVAEAIVSLREEGQLISIAEVARRAKANWRTVKKNWDLICLVAADNLEEEGLEPQTNLILLTPSAHVINPGGSEGSRDYGFETCSIDDPISNNALEASLEPIEERNNFPWTEINNQPGISLVERAELRFSFSVFGSKPFFVIRSSERRSCRGPPKIGPVVFVCVDDNSA